MNPPPRGWSLAGRLTPRRTGDLDHPTSAPPLDDPTVVRDAEESLVAALQESDTALEVLQDEAAQPGPRWRSRRGLTLTGVVLAAIALVVLKRRG